MKKDFVTHRNGEWIQPIMRGYRVKCCQCGAVHRINFRVGVDEKGRERVQFQAFAVRPRKVNGR
jgi:hypothetical protein